MATGRSADKSEASTSSIRRPGRSTAASTVRRPWGSAPRKSTLILATSMSGRGLHRSMARASSADGGPPCCRVVSYWLAVATVDSKTSSSILR